MEIFELGGDKFFHGRTMLQLLRGLRPNEDNPKHICLQDEKLQIALLLHQVP
jgi:hypothetical protein